MLTEITRLKSKGKIPDGACRVGKNGIRLHETIIDQEMIHLPSSAHRDLLYIKFFADDDGFYWFALFEYAVQNSIRVSVNTHKSGYVYFNVRYPVVSRKIDGVNFTSDIYTCDKVKIFDGRRHRKLEPWR